MLKLGKSPIVFGSFATVLSLGMMAARIESVRLRVEVPRTLKFVSVDELKTEVPEWTEVHANHTHAGEESFMFMCVTPRIIIPEEEEDLIDVQLRPQELYPEDPDLRL